MCNLFRMRSGPGDILAVTRAMTSDVGNLEPRDTYPDYPAPIVRHDEAGERVLTLARWGLPSLKITLQYQASAYGEVRSRGNLPARDALPANPIGTGPVSDAKTMTAFDPKRSLDEPSLEVQV